MTALLDEEIPATIAPELPLPDRFRAEMTSEDEPVHGRKREIFPRTARPGREDPFNLRPSDFVLDGDGLGAVWLRVKFVEHGATGSRVHCWSGHSFPVPAGAQVWVWPARDVMAWMALSETAGGAR